MLIKTPDSEEETPEHWFPTIGARTPWGWQKRQF